MHTPDIVPASPPAIPAPPAPTPTSFTRTDADRLIRQNWRLICFIAKRYEGAGIPRDDLQAVAAAAFLSALATWDSARGNLAMYSSFVMQSHLRQACAVERRQSADSLDVPSSHDEGTGDTSLDRLTSRTPSPFEAASRLETRALIGAAMRRLNARQRAVLVLRFGVGLTLDETAGAIGRTRERARQLQDEALTRLRFALGCIRADRVD